MKIGGREISGVHEVILILPRGVEEEVIIRAKAILDLDSFYNICPEPKPPGRLTKNGYEPNKEDENYQFCLMRHMEQRIAFLVIKSLEPSNIEWDTTDINNPSTWTNYILDFKNAGFSSVEINRIVGAVMEANALDEKKLEKAREVFIRGQHPVQEKSSIPTIEPQSMPSGEPANVSE